MAEQTQEQEKQNNSLNFSQEQLSRITFEKSQEEETHENVDISGYSDEQIESLIEKEESELSDDEKKVIDFLKREQEKLDKEQEIDLSKFTEEQIEELKNKKEEELTDDDKKILEALSEEESKPSTTMGQLVQSVGIEEFANKEYENNDEGLRSFANDLKDYQKESGVKEAFSKMPILAAMYEHLEQGRSPETFLAQFETPDFDRFDLKTEDGKKDLLKYFYSSQNMSKEESEYLIEKLTNEGKLDERSKAIHSNLKKERELELKRIKDEEDLELQNARVQEEKTLNEIKSVIQKGKIRGISLSDKESKEFMNYITPNIKTNNGIASQFEIDYSTLSLEDKLFIRLFTKNKGKIKGLEAKKIENEQFGKLGEQNNNRFKNGKEEVNKNKNIKLDKEKILSHLRK